MERNPLRGRRAAVALAAAGALVLPAVAAHGAERSPQAPTATWSLKWSPASGASVADAFEGAEDDRADSHPGVTHIYPSGGGFRTDIHYPKDVDTSTDRQRNEVRGMRQNGAAVKILKDETWRIQYQMYVPDTLDATTGFTHIMQIKVGDVAAPLFTMSLHRHDGGPKVEMRTSDDAENLTEAGAAGMAPIQGKWSEVSVEVKASDSGAYVDWSVVTDGATVAKHKRTGLDMWRGKNYLRPKWGIYRSLISGGGLQTTYLLTRNFKAYKLQ